MGGQTTANSAPSTGPSVPAPPSGPTITVLGQTANIFDTPQVYQTIPITNKAIALYQLYISPVTAGATAVGAGSSPGANPSPTSYIFPLSPESLQYSVINLSNYFETQGINPSVDNGVLRIIDQYGLTPPIISISGNTGFKYHSLDGFQWDGKQSVLQLEALLRTYATMVKTAASTGQTIPGLYLNDSWKQQTWQVIPFGPQNFQMSNSRPLLTNYLVSFIATQAPNISSSLFTPNSDYIINDLFSPQPTIALAIQYFLNSASTMLNEGLSYISNPSNTGSLSVFPSILQGPASP